MLPANVDLGSFCSTCCSRSTPPTPPRRSLYLLWDPAVFSCGAALLVEESVEIYCLYAAAAPVFIPTQKTNWQQLEKQFLAVQEMDNKQPFHQRDAHKLVIQRAAAVIFTSEVCNVADLFLITEL